MHVIKIRDSQGAERIYSANLLTQNGSELTFMVKGKEMVVLTRDLLEMVEVFKRQEDS